MKKQRYIPPHQRYRCAELSPRFKRKVAKAVTLAAVLFMFFAIGLVGRCDYEDQQAQHRFNCQMIEGGHWPKSVDPSCGKEE